MFNRGFFFLTGLFVGLSASTLAMADNSSNVSSTIHHLYESQRALGMGDAFTAVANDYSAIFYNPAGLARREEGQVNLSLNVGATPALNDFYSDFNKISNSGASDSQKQTDYFNLIQKHYGDVYTLRLAPLEGILVRPKWGVALIPADVSIELSMHKQVGPMVNATVYGDTTLAFSYADDVHWFNYGRLSLGGTAKFVNRAFFSKAVSATELAANSQIVKREDMLEGYTIDADLGLLWTPEIPDQGLWSVIRLARPTFGMVVHNIAETGFGQTMKLINSKPTQSGTPEKLYRVIDLGSKWEYPSAWIFGGRGVLDVRDIGHPNWNWHKGLHAGLEFDWAVKSWWKGHYRGGFSEGYWTAGVSAELGIFNLDVVSYANDVGSFDTPVESRVYAAKLNLDF